MKSVLLWKNQINPSSYKPIRVFQRNLKSNKTILFYRLLYNLSERLIELKKREYNFNSYSHLFMTNKLIINTDMTTHAPPPVQWKVTLFWFLFFTKLDNFLVFFFFSLICLSDKKFYSPPNILRVSISRKVHQC